MDKAWTAAEATQLRLNAPWIVCMYLEVCLGRNLERVNGVATITSDKQVHCV